jgi:hypothetical protein
MAQDKAKDIMGEDRTETAMADVVEKLKLCDLLVELLSAERVEWESAIGQLREGGELAVGDAFMNAMHFASLSARHARVLADVARLQFCPLRNRRTRICSR